MTLESTVFVKTMKTHKLSVELVMVRCTCGMLTLYRLCPGVKVTVMYARMIFVFCSVLIVCLQ